MNDNFRDRFKAVRNRHNNHDGDSLFKLWDDQKRMQAEDKQLETELQAAKRRAKELKQTLRKHKLGESKEITKQYVSKGKSFTKSTYDFSKNVAKKYPKQSVAVGVALIITIIGLNVLSRDDTNTATLGDTTGIKIQDDLPREKPKFNLLTPNGDDESQYDIVRISPDDADPSFTFLDRFTGDGQIFRVTQQLIPDNFDIKKTATDFQATNIIQVDDVTVYHGYSEKGGIQSLLFEKADKLISIRSPQKFSDDMWASYIASLK